MTESDMPQQAWRENLQLKSERPSILFDLDVTALWDLRAAP
jgi:hypothetical protein